MADLSDLQAAQTVKIVGVDSSGVETNPVAADSNGNIKAIDYATSLTGSAVPSNASFIGAKNPSNNLVGLLTDIAGNLLVSSTPPTDRIGTGTITALNGAVAVNTQGCSTVVFNITGTWSATIVVEATVDGSNWLAISGINVVSELSVSSTTSNLGWRIRCGGYAQVRLKSSVFTSGTINIAYDASPGVNLLNPTWGNNNQTLPLQSNLIGGSDGTNIVPVAVDSQGRLVTSAVTGFGADFAFGDITTAALTRVLVRRTVYTEQSTNGQRSVASASANDTSAGTGARTVKITYYDQTGAGPFTETLTMSGTTRVNTVATNICFIEQMEVLTAGSGGVNAGIITLFTLPTSGGTSIGTIAAGDNQTFWAHHYVPIGKTCNITGISCGHNGTTVGSGALFTLNAKPINVANSIESQVSDFVRLYGQTSTFARNYQSPIKVNGPARIQMYVTPETTSSIIYRGAFDFFEP